MGSLLYKVIGSGDKHVSEMPNGTLNISEGSPGEGLFFSVESCKELREILDTFLSGKGYGSIAPRSTSYRPGPAAVRRTAAVEKLPDGRLIISL